MEWERENKLREGVMLLREQGRMWNALEGVKKINIYTKNDGGNTGVVR